MYRPEFFCIPTVTGTLKLAGRFSNVDAGLLDFVRLANVGNNTNFDQGQLGM
ncbi:MAG: hypothetical protein IJR93_04210 [Treponema sp.]|nr:hypothetical protein [Treponema sp.]